MPGRAMFQNYRIRSLALIFLSFVALPLSTAIAFCSYSIGVFRSRSTSRSSHSASGDESTAPGSLSRTNVAHNISYSGSGPFETTPFSYTNPIPASQSQRRRSSQDNQKTVLVTGLSMAKGLVLARLFHQAGYQVIGADMEPSGIPIPGRFSSSLAAFFRLSPPTTLGASPHPQATDAPSALEEGVDASAYISSLISVIRTIRADIWVSVSAAASVLADAEAAEAVRCQTTCVPIQFGVEATRILHRKDLFAEWLVANGFSAPLTGVVHDAEEVEEFLETHASKPKHGRKKSKGKDANIAWWKGSGSNSGPSSPVKERVQRERRSSAPTPGSQVREATTENRRFILKPLSLGDAARGDMTLLPARMVEETWNILLHRLPSSNPPRSLDAATTKHSNGPWILQEYVEGQTFCTFALVIRGKVRAFVACRSSDMLMRYEALPASGALSRAMETFTRDVAAGGRHRSYAEAVVEGRIGGGAVGGEDFTGHLSFDFIIPDEDVRAAGACADPHSVSLFPIECNPRVHTAVVLFNGMPGLTEEYLEALHDEKRSGKQRGIPGTSSSDFHEVEHSIYGKTSQSTADSPLETVFENGATAVLHPSNPPPYIWYAHELPAYLARTLEHVMNPSLDSLVANVTEMIELARLLITGHDGNLVSWDPLPWLWANHVYWPLRLALRVLWGEPWSRANVSTGEICSCT
ncbi:hypothetical protein BDY21DRAFT_351945 [Lineolata rhizophorae]|uniref:ATP-grasp domain-containing protein n=1 Tax=Lineolata rhizophorae TaxID=578093 RepID=A0A6A6NT70_9PEZI|nr:hypothetical protein BDY21DRAFT_351945 [Lineolata rhizophorae]